MEVDMKKTKYYVIGGLIILILVPFTYLPARDNTTNPQTRTQRQRIIIKKDTGEDEQIEIERVMDPLRRSQILLRLGNRLKLDLTDDQKEQIKEILRELAQERIELTAEVKKARLAYLQALADKDQRDYEVRSKWEAVRNAENKLKEKQMNIRLSIRNVLNEEQWEKLNKVRTGRNLRALRQRGSGAFPGVSGPGIQQRFNRFKPGIQQRFNRFKPGIQQRFNRVRPDVQFRFNRGRPGIQRRFNWNRQGIQPQFDRGLLWGQHPSERGLQGVQPPFERGTPENFTPQLENRLQNLERQMQEFGKRTREWGERFKKEMMKRQEEKSQGWKYENGELLGFGFLENIFGNEETAAPPEVEIPIESMPDVTLMDEPIINY